MQLPPSSVGLGAVLLNQPVAGATEFPAHAVYQNVEELAVAARVFRREKGLFGHVA